MTEELISKRTRNAFREFLVRWTLREIESEFESAGVDCDRSFEPAVDGQRRSFVEQHYRTLDFAKPADVRRVLLAYQSILERAEMMLAASHGREEAEQALTHLKACLAKDGFAYDDGRITSNSPSFRAAFEQARSISEITRRAIFDELIAGGVAGAVGFPNANSSRDCIPSQSCPYDGRYRSMERDIIQHRENNLDWDEDWVFTDSRLDLMSTTDQSFLRFLCEMAHPVVRPDAKAAKALVAGFNDHLRVDGWGLVEGRAISNRSSYVARRLGSSAVTLPDSVHHTDVLSDDYVRELANKCDSRLVSGDLDGAVTVARTLLEAVLTELEIRLAGSKGEHKGDLPKQFKDVTKLLRMDAQRSDLDDRFKDVIRGLVMVVHGLAPLRNKMSDGHAREFKPAPHHARVVVNAAKTVTGFLVDSYGYQRAKELIQDVAPVVKKVAE